MLSSEGLSLKILAEDLGYLDDGVKCLLRLSGLPGMDIWQFSSHEMLSLTPEQAEKRAFYTGTHDNDTLIGFVRKYLEKSIPPEEREDQDREPETVTKEEAEAEAQRIIREIYQSSARLAMVQIQDVFMLGSDARMNVPGVAEGNWTWKIDGRSVWAAFDDADERARWFSELASETRR